MGTLPTIETRGPGTIETRCQVPATHQNSYTYQTYQIDSFVSWKRPSRPQPSPYLAVDAIAAVDRRVLVTARRARAGSSSESERGAGGAPQRAGAQRQSPRGSPVVMARRTPRPGRKLRSSEARGNQRLGERVRGGTPRVAAARPPREHSAR